MHPGGAEAPKKKKKKAQSEPAIQQDREEAPQDEEEQAKETREEVEEGEQPSGDARQRALSSRSVKSAAPAAGEPAKPPKNDIFDEPEDNNPFASSGKGLFKVCPVPLFSLVCQPD